MGQTVELRVRAALAVRGGYSVEPVVAMAMPKAAAMLSGAAPVALLEMRMPPELVERAGLHSTAGPVAAVEVGAVPVRVQMEVRAAPADR